MKKICTTIVFLLIVEFSFCQIYYSNYVDSTSEWRVLEILQPGPTKDLRYSTRFFDGFENIDGYTYYKMYETFYEISYIGDYTIITEPQSANQTIFLGYFREDPNGKFYFRSYNTEWVVMDNLAVANYNAGDDFLYYGYNSYIPFIVCSVSNVSIVNVGGINAKVAFTNTNFIDGGSAVEGVGNLTGTCATAQIFDISSTSDERIHCYSKQGQVTSFFNNYTLGANYVFFVNCDSFPVANRQGLDSQVFTKNEIQIYPNPTKNIINIELNRDVRETMVKVIDVQGRILQDVFFNGSKISLDLKDYNKGVYFVNITNSEMQQTFKIIKE